MKDFQNKVAVITGAGGGVGGALALMGMPWDKVMHQIEIMSAVPGRMNCLAGERGQPAAVIDGARSSGEQSVRAEVMAWLASKANTNDGVRNRDMRWYIGPCPLRQVSDVLRGYWSEYS